MEEGAADLDQAILTALLKSRLTAIILTFGIVQITDFVGLICDLWEIFSSQLLWYFSLLKAKVLHKKIN